MSLLTLNAVRQLQCM